MDLLEHEVGIVAHADILRRQCQRPHGVLDPAGVAMEHAEGASRDHRHLVIGEVDDPVGVAGERVGIAGDEVLAVADAHHQRASQAGGHQHVGPVTEQHEQTVGAAKLRDRLPHRHHPRRVGGIVGHRAARGQCPREATVDKVGDHLGVGFGTEDVPLRFEAILDGTVVFDHTVVDDRDGSLAVPTVLLQRVVPFIAAEVRMGVGVGWGAVCGPTGVADADGAIGNAGPHKGLQPREPARRLEHMDLARVGQQGDPGGIVAAVFEPSQPLENDVCGATKPDVSNDAAHGESSGQGAGAAMVRGRPDGSLGMYWHGHTPDHTSILPRKGAFRHESFYRHHCDPGPALQSASAPQDAVGRHGPAAHRTHLASRRGLRTGKACHCGHR